MTLLNHLATLNTSLLNHSETAATQMLDCLLSLLRAGWGLGLTNVAQDWATGNKLSSFVFPNQSRKLKLGIQREAQEQKYHHLKMLTHNTM